MNCDTLTSKELKRRFLLYVFDREESSKLRLRQWQHILDLETYIIDAGGGDFIWFFGSMSSVEDPFRRKGDTLWMTPWGGESHMRVRQFWRNRGGLCDPRGHDGIAPLSKCHYNFLAGFPLLGGGWGWGDPPHYPKNRLVLPHVRPPLFWRKNIDFVIV